MTGELIWGYTREPLLIYTVAIIDKSLLTRVTLQMNTMKIMDSQIRFIVILFFRTCTDFFIWNFYLMYFFSLLNAQPFLQTYKTSHNDLVSYKKSQNNNNNRLTHNLVCGIVGLSISPPEDHGSLEVQLQVYSS